MHSRNLWRPPRWLALLLTLCAMAFGLSALSISAAPPAVAAGEKAVIGMPFNGQWAYSNLTNAGCGPASNQTSHPSCHELYFGDWSVDLYASAGTEVKLRVSSSGSLSFTWDTGASGSCGETRRVKVYTGGTYVGMIHFTHLANAASTASAPTNNMVVGKIANLSCNPGGSGKHIHFEVKNAPAAGYSCYANYSTQTNTAGMGVTNGYDLGVLGTNKSGTRQACAPSDIPGTTPPYQPPADTDADGIADSSDECDDIPGVDYQQGCRQQMGTFRGDFNADGDEDVASFYMYPERGSAMSLLVWDGNGDGTLQPARVAYYDASGWGADRVIPAGVGDFNKDGHPDIAIFYRYPNTVVRTIVWYGHADGTFNMAIATVDNQMEGANLIPMGTGDYNGDGNADIAALYRYPERGNALSAIVWYGTSSGTLNQGQAVWYNASGWDGHQIVPIGSGNFFDDGRTDFAVFYDYGNGVTRMLTWYGRTDGTFYDPTVTFYASSGWAGKHLVPAGVGDFNGDGKDDVASFYGYPERGNAVSLYIWRGNGDGTFQAPHLSWYTPSGWWWLNLIPGGISDLDGNSRAEVNAFYNYGASTTRLFAWVPDASADVVGDLPILDYRTDMAAVNLRP